MEGTTDLVCFIRWQLKKLNPHVLTTYCQLLYSFADADRLLVWPFCFVVTTADTHKTAVLSHSSLNLSWRR